MLYFAGAALAVLIERFVGYPQSLLARIGHPVQWMGQLITLLDERLNTATDDQLLGRLQGAAALLALCVAVGISTWLAAMVLHSYSGGWIIDALLATTLIAQKSMRDHVLDVSRALSSSMSEARSAVAKIVGRETKSLDESGVARAALESLAENTADGIVAPVFWYALLGLPGIAIYKAINTADSMIGHKSERHLHFGFAAAKLDDLVNLPASRLTALLFAAAAWLKNRLHAENAWKIAWRDADKHRSPNAGWPEAAMAGALNLRFGGPRFYENEYVDLPWMGDGREALTRNDISAGLQLYDRALWIMFGLLVLLAVCL